MHSALLLSQSIEKIKWFSTIALLRTPSELGDRLYQTWPDGKFRLSIQWESIGKFQFWDNRPSLRDSISELRWSSKECYGAKSFYFSILCDRSNEESIGQLRRNIICIFFVKIYYFRWIWRPAFCKFTYGCILSGKHVLGQFRVPRMSIQFLI